VGASANAGKETPQFKASILVPRADVLARRQGPDEARAGNGARMREPSSRRKQHQLLGFPRFNFGRMNLEVHNQRFHDGIPVFLFAAYVVEMLSGQDCEPTPERVDVLVLPVIVVMPGGQYELAVKTGQRFV
jgi:hypothetical protein